MDPIHLALLIIGGLIGLEALAGLIKPDKIKKLTQTMVRTTEKTSPVIGVFHFIAAFFLWALVMKGLPLSYWVLLFVGATIGLLGLLCFRPGGLQKLMRGLIADRSIGTIRMFYAGELMVGVVLLWIALFSK